MQNFTADPPVPPDAKKNFFQRAKNSIKDASWVSLGWFSGPILDMLLAPPHASSKLFLMHVVLSAGLSSSSRCFFIYGTWPNSLSCAYGSLVRIIARLLVWTIGNIREMETGFRAGQNPNICLQCSNNYYLWGAWAAGSKYSSLNEL